MFEIFNLLLSVLKKISVEPVVFLGALATFIFNLCTDLGTYRVMCDQTYNAGGGTDLNNHSYFECWDSSRPLGPISDNNETEWWHEAEIELQQKNATYST